MQAGRSKKTMLGTFEFNESHLNLLFKHFAFYFIALLSINTYKSCFYELSSSIYDCFNKTHTSNSIFYTNNKNINVLIIFNNFSVFLHKIFV